MSVHTTYKCDAEGCQNMKGENNHWLQIVIKPSFHGSAGSFSIFRWGEVAGYPTRLEDAVKHVCGSSCASKMLSQWMDNQQGIGTTE